MAKKKKTLEPVRVRIAPSPTGDPHVGTAYIALFNKAFAKSQQGKFILRIEDTDRKRSRKSFEKQILSSLKWLGLTWDEGPDIGGKFGPYRQSERQDIYQKHAIELVKAGKAYPCFCSPERLAELREKQKAEKSSHLGYDGLCRKIPKKKGLERMKREKHVIRLKVPHRGSTSFQDFLRGKISIENQEIDDQILLKADGMPTYHLANVVDDHLMKISHVIRAEEWITSTPKHILLYKAFGWKPPVFCHMPLLRNPDGSKISKRKNPCSLTYYQKQGFLPESLCNFLGLQGYSMKDEREKFSFEEFVEDFDLKRVKTRGPVFDLQKLYHLNSLYLHEMAPKDFKKELMQYFRKQIQSFGDLAQPRMEIFADFVPVMDFIYRKKSQFQPELDKVAPKKISAEDGISLLKDFQLLFSQVPWKKQKLDEALQKYIKESSFKKGPIFMLLRVATTGRLNTPPLMETLEKMERFQVLERLEKTIEVLRSMKDQ